MHRGVCVCMCVCVREREKERERERDCIRQRRWVDRKSTESRVSKLQILMTHCHNCQDFLWCNSLSSSFFCYNFFFWFRQAVFFYSFIHMCIHCLGHFSRIYSFYRGFVVTILIRLILYIIYIDPHCLSCSAPSLPHLKQLQEVS
jgi:hypothetical protein